MTGSLGTFSEARAVTLTFLLSVRDVLLAECGPVRLRRFQAGPSAALELGDRIRARLGGILVVPRRNALFVDSLDLPLTFAPCSRCASTVPHLQLRVPPVAHHPTTNLLPDALQQARRSGMAA